MRSQDLSAVDGLVRKEPAPPRSFLRFPNIPVKFVSLAVLKSLFTYILSSLSLSLYSSGRANILSILITLEVSKWERSRVVRLDMK